MANTSGHQNFVLQGAELSGTFFFESGHKLFNSLLNDKIGEGKFLEMEIHLATYVPTLITTV